MRIKLDDEHYLVSEPECSWVIKVVEYKDGKSKGKKYDKRVSGYYRTVDKTIESYYEGRINASQSTSVKALVKEIKDTREQIRNWTEVLKGVTNGN